MGSLLELQAPELDFRGDSAGTYYPNQNPQMLINPGDMQVLEFFFPLDAVQLRLTENG